MTQWKRYLLWFAQDLVEFRYAEIQSLLKVSNIPHKLPTIKPGSVESLRPFCEIDLPNDDYARKLASRSISIRCILEQWASATTYDDFHRNLKEFVAINQHNENLQRVFDDKITFKITVETYNNRITQAERVEKIKTLDYLPAKGRCNLSNPDVEWYFIEYYGLDPGNIPANPEHIMFGKLIGNGNRDMINELSLKTRKFIGNTSMDPKLSLLMANQALVKDGDLVFDPFVGSGSLLVAAAKYGGYVVGSDIDFLMLHGRSKPTRVRMKQRAQDECVLANLKQYKCADRYVDVLVSDFSNSIWLPNIRFDSIITDPPYGIREATEKIRTKSKRGVPHTPSDGDTPRYPSTSHYNLTSLYTDLLNFAAKHLEMNGRLVCWIPVMKSDYTESVIPQHNCLRLVANSEQTISSVTSRRLLTYKKIAQPSEDEQFVSANEIPDFRQKYFSAYEDSRKERRMQRDEWRNFGRAEAIKDGRINGDNLKAKNNKNNK